jgi:anti-sigma regulatory factor (Ser/Thr protein kinase)
MGRIPCASSRLERIIAWRAGRTAVSPIRTPLELGALPTAVPCARLHARHVLWEWGLNGLAPDSELLVSELVTNAVKATAGRDEAAVRLRLSGDSARVLIEVWDPDPRAPAPKDLGGLGTPDPQEEGGRGLFLVAALGELGLVSHTGPCGQGCLVRARGVIARAARSGGGGGNHRSFGQIDQQKWVRRDSVAGGQPVDAGL